MLIKHFRVVIVLHNWSVMAWWYGKFGDLIVMWSICLWSAWSMKGGDLWGEELPWDLTWARIVNQSNESRYSINDQSKLRKPIGKWGDQNFPLSSVWHHDGRKSCIIPWSVKYPESVTEPAYRVGAHAKIQKNRTGRLLCAELRQPIPLAGLYSP
jgi:hypothetical protein